MKKLLALVAALNFITAVSGAAEKPALNVRDFGAKGDSTNKNTVAIQKALEACAENGATQFWCRMGLI